MVSLQTVQWFSERPLDHHNLQANQAVHMSICWSFSNLDSEQHERLQTCIDFQHNFSQKKFRILRMFFSRKFVPWARLNLQWACARTTVEHIFSLFSKLYQLGLIFQQNRLHKVVNVARSSLIRLLWYQNWLLDDFWVTIVKQLESVLICQNEDL